MSDTFATIGEFQEQLAELDDVVKRLPYRSMVEAGHAHRAVLQCRDTVLAHVAASSSEAVGTHGWREVHGLAVIA